MGGDAALSALLKAIRDMPREAPMAKGTRPSSHLWSVESSGDWVADSDTGERLAEALDRGNHRPRSRVCLISSSRRRL
jgi:hypothetical protein